MSLPAKLDPNAVYEQMRIAHRELVRGDVDASQSALCKASRWATNNTTVLLDLTQLLLIRRDGKAAAEWAQRTVNLDPTSARAQEQLGDALARIGKPDQARQAWLTAAHVSETDVAALDLLVREDLYEAQRALKRRDYRRAERFFRRVISFQSADAIANAGLAAALLKLGDSSAANIWAGRAAAFREDDPGKHRLSAPK